ncbi:MAG: hypothetical protein GAK45_00148 [Pseudomonas citronellolis]|nr:MAG: hypothetical protein GAK45_00148 [Pseudomonas citronellolis]
MNRNAPPDEQASARTRKSLPDALHPDWDLSTTDDRDERPPLHGPELSHYHLDIAGIDPAQPPD